MPQNFKNGISILTRADFFSLGNRTDAYLSIAPDIAQYDEYRKVVIDHLYQVKLRHWDIKIRHLSSQALGNIAMLDVGYFTGEVIPYLLRNSLDERDVQLRHGSVLGIAEIILAIGILKDKNGGSFELLLSPELALSTAELVPIIEKKRLYRGKGGEQMRAAVCRLIECIAMANIPLSVPLQVRLLDSIDACIPHPKEDIQEQATLALAHITRAYFPVGPLGPSDRLQKRILEKYVNQVKTSLNPAATRGFTMALGRLPAKLLAPSSIVLDLSLACLCQMSRPDATIGGERDAETRRNALVALARICNTVTMTQQGNNGVNISGLSSKQVGSVFAALFRGLDDYNMELRGDVGSMSRIASMHGLVSLAIATNSRPVCAVEEVFDEEICRKLVCGLLKQLVEKLDAVRLEAGKCLVKLLVHTEPGVPHIVEKGRLMDVLGITTDGEMKLSINWADASVTFPLVTQCLDIDEYFPSIVAGLVISVGCLTQSVAKEAGAAFVSWVKIASNNCVYRLGTGKN